MLPPLKDALIEVANVLDDLGVPYMVIGGLAAGIWGDPRGTVDVDVTISMDSRSRTELFELLKSRLVLRQPDALEKFKATGILRAYTSKGTIVDIVVAQHAFQEKALSRALVVEVEGHKFRVCTPEDLVLYKIISDRTQDQLDVRELVLRRWSTMDTGYVERHLKSLCEDFDVDEPLQKWMALLKDIRELHNDPSLS